MQVRLIACLSAVLILCYASSLVYGQQLTQPERIPIGALYDLTIVNITTGQSTAAASSTIAMASALKLGFDDINAAQQIVPGSQFDLAVYDSQSTISGSLAALLHATETNNSYSVLGGPNTSNQCTITAVASASYNILLVSASASASGLNNTALYRLFSRMVAGDNFQTNAMVQFIQFYYNQTLEPNWLSVAVICTADDYGVSGSKDFINKAPGYNITLSTFQNFLLGATDVSVEVGELKNSASRVFIAFMAVAGFQTVIQQAKEEKLIHEEYIWICSDGCATDAIFEGLNSKDEQDFRDNVSGMFGTVPRGGSGTAYDEFLQRWKTLDPVKYPGTGGNPTIFALLAYDSAYLMAYLYRIHFDLGNYDPTGTDLFSVVSLVTFEGLTGNVSMQTNGDRRGNYYVVNYNNNRNVQEFNPVFTWDVAEGLVQIDDPVWYDGTTKIPDLGVLSSFQYWSCHKKEALTDKTGKTIKRVKPDGDDPNNIDIDYECDQYIDCDNMSDEAYQCTPSIVIAFIVVGIITGLLVLGNCLFIPAIILFSWILPRVRLILAGRFFLLFLTISCILGSISTYAWYGKPETVACNFQLWLFGIATSIMVGSIFAKNMTRFRSLGIPIKVVRKLKVPPELEFLVYFVIVFVIPIIIIVIWTIISTPKADLENHSDADHWVCTTGGPTGDPGGIVFFFILVGYYGFLLLLSFILLFLNRKTPYRFMDSRLMFISMFNLGFLAAVIIPVFFVLRWISPFAAWLVRTLGMLYGFNSTLWIHIVPKSIGLVICDKFKDNTSGPTTSAVKHRAGHDDDPSLSASLTQSTTIG